ncbi:hypothetical protein EGH25_10390 [Haladaptatus sp. F3-133]|uniref:Uncharacterized protein n=1 Tax=Halorutilus salinus TaxID=2487751 RepID=A0A9Q4GK17_9EURY|nr:hypothetical protein [Halorutilus salinus]MCX2819756.1 hypothetical protein [Halorutilus salinus]
MGDTTGAPRKTVVLVAEMAYLGQSAAVRNNRYRVCHRAYLTVAPDPPTETMSVLSRLKEILLGDKEALAAAAKVRSIYEEADEPEKFATALQDGDFEEAAEYHTLSAEELKDEFDDVLSTGKGLAQEYTELSDSDKNEFVEA